MPVGASLIWPPSLTELSLFPFFKILIRRCTSYRQPLRVCFPLYERFHLGTSGRRTPGRLRAVFSLSDFRCLHQRDGETINRFLKHLDEEMHITYPKGFHREDVQYTTLSNDKVMLLNYTSGTTGFSKGVMLTGNNSQEMSLSVSAPSC